LKKGGPRGPPFVFSLELLGHLEDVVVTCFLALELIATPGRMLGSRGGLRRRRSLNSFGYAIVPAWPQTPELGSAVFLSVERCPFSS
jgi:hypothetical protein